MSPADIVSGAYYAAAGAQEKMEVEALQQRMNLTHDSPRLLLVMVGMPARGKSFISAKLSSFLTWAGHRTGTFNAGQQRRRTSVTARLENGSDTTCSNAAFFDPANSAAASSREEIAMAVLERAFEWFDEGGEIAIFDATNSTEERRSKVVKAALEHGTRRGETIGVVFLESLCDDERVLEANMRTKVRNSPDFATMDEEAAMSDLRRRIANYESVYSTVKDEEGAYIKLFNFSSKVTANQCYGRMAKKILPFVMAIHTDDRPVFIAALQPRKREPEYCPTSGLKLIDTSACSIIDLERQDSSSSSSTEESPRGGFEQTWTTKRKMDSSPKVSRRVKGRFDRADLDLGVGIAEWWSEQHPEKRLLVFASTRPTAVEAASELARRCPNVTVSHTSALNPLVYCDDSTDHEAFLAGAPRRSFTDRGVGGESYADLVLRLESCVLDVESSVDAVLLLTHATPARALRAYFRKIDVSECMGAANSLETMALTGSAPRVLEIRQQVGGGWMEKIHDVHQNIDED